MISFRCGTRNYSTLRESRRRREKKFHFQCCCCYYVRHNFYYFITLFYIILFYGYVEKSSLTNIYLMFVFIFCFCLFIQDYNTKEMVSCYESIFIFSSLFFKTRNLSCNDIAKNFKFHYFCFI